MAVNLESVSDESGQCGVALRESSHDQRGWMKQGGIEKVLGRAIDEA
jgi:hypothetical protein